MRTCVLRAAALFLLVTALLGLVLRADLASGAWSSAGWSFPYLRHAHSHAGFYGFLTVPILLLLGFPAGGRIWFAYLAAAAGAVVAFATGGYTWLSIALSNVILAVWLVAAVRTLLRREGGFPAAAAAGLLLGAALIAPVAVLGARGDPLAVTAARLFVAALVFTVYVPGTLAWIGAASRRTAALWVPAGLAAAVSAAVPLSPLLALPLALPLAWLLAEQAAGSTFPRGLAPWWLLLASALVAGALVPHWPALRIAGVHAVVLGPLLVSLAWGAGRVSAIPLPVRLAYAPALALMIGAIALAPWIPVGQGAAVTLFVSALFLVVLVPAVGFALFVKPADGTGRRDAHEYANRIARSHP